MILASEKEPLLRDIDTLTLHDGTDGHVWLDVDGVFSSCNGANIADLGNELGKFTGKFRSVNLYHENIWESNYTSYSAQCMIRGESYGWNLQFGNMG